MLANNWDSKYGSGFTESSDQKIVDIERRVAMKEMQLNDIQYELNLIKQDRLNIYKRSVYYGVVTEFCRNAWHWNAALKSGTLNGQKLDRRKHYNEKDSYDYLVKWIDKYIGHDCWVTDIYEYNFGEAWEICFSADEHEWILTIPVIGAIKQKSLDAYGSYVFKLSLSIRTGEHSTKVVGSTFQEDELNKIYEEALNELGSAN